MPSLMPAALCGEEAGTTLQASTTPGEGRRASCFSSDPPSASAALAQPLHVYKRPPSPLLTAPTNSTIPRASSKSGKTAGAAPSQGRKGCRRSRGPQPGSALGRANRHCPPIASAVRGLRWRHRVPQSAREGSRFGKPLGPFSAAVDLPTRLPRSSPLGNMKASALGRSKRVELTQVKRKARTLNVGEGLLPPPYRWEAPPKPASQRRELRFPPAFAAPRGRPALSPAHTGCDWLPGGGRGLPQPIGKGLVTAAEAAALG